MKLLLTSDGLTNKTITETLLKLLTKSPKDCRVVFIPTASNIIAKDRKWMIDELIKYRDLGFPYIDIVDISAIAREDWEPRLRSADILLVGGGNPFYLKYWFIKSGLKDILPELLQDKVYVGVSAGSMILAPNLLIAPKEQSIKYLEKDQEIVGLGIIDFAVMPHYEMGEQDTSEKHVEAISRNANLLIYGLDDDSAVVINGDILKVVSEGKWRTFE